jgi:hypothetical protein
MMSSAYQSIVKQYLDRHRTAACSLPENIKRGWLRKATARLPLNERTVILILLGVYTADEEYYHQQICLIGPDVQIANSTVRSRLALPQTQMKKEMEMLRNAFDLPDELLTTLALESEHSSRDRFRRNSIDRQFTSQPYTLQDIVQQLHSAAGRDLVDEESGLIRELMQIVQKHAPDEVRRIHEEFVKSGLTRRFVDVPKLIQVTYALQFGDELDPDRCRR